MDVFGRMCQVPQLIVQAIFLTWPAEDAGGAPPQALLWALVSSTLSLIYSGALSFMKLLDPIKSNDDYMLFAVHFTVVEEGTNTRNVNRYLWHSRLGYRKKLAKAFAEHMGVAPRDVNIPSAAPYKDSCTIFVCLLCCFFVYEITSVHVCAADRSGGTRDQRRPNTANTIEYEQ